MEKLGARAPSWRRPLRVALVAAGAALLPAVPASAAEAGGPGLLSPRLGCGQDQGAVGASLLARVRHPGKRGTKVPEASAEEMPAVFLHAFYTCAAAAPAPVPIGAGWLAAGPVRRG